VVDKIHELFNLSNGRLVLRHILGHLLVHVNDVLVCVLLIVIVVVLKRLVRKLVEEDRQWVGHLVVVLVNCLLELLHVF